MKFPRELTRTIKAFGYYDALDVSEAVTVLNEMGDRIVVLAGGTDLLNQMKVRQVVPEFIVNIKNIRDLEYIREHKGLEIGPLTRITAIRESGIAKGAYRSLLDAAEWFGTPQIRNMATVGGNICRSSPSSDMIAPLMALDAKLTLVGAKGERSVSIEDFLVGAGKNILDREILVSITVPEHEGEVASAFHKLKRSSADLAKVSGAVKMVLDDGRCGDVRIVLGAVAEKTFRSKEAEKVLRGQKISPSVIEEAARKASREAKPITDVRSTADYRLEMVNVLVRRLVGLAFERARR